MAKQECVLWEYGECMYMCATCPYGHLDEYWNSGEKQQAKKASKVDKAAKKSKGGGKKCTM